MEELLLNAARRATRYLESLGERRVFPSKPPPTFAQRTVKCPHCHPAGEQRGRQTDNGGGYALCYNDLSLPSHEQNPSPKS